MKKVKDMPHEIIVRPGHFDGADGYECPACSVISSERQENDDGKQCCRACGYISGDAPKTPASIFF